MINSILPQRQVRLCAAARHWPLRPKRAGLCDAYFPESHEAYDRNKSALTELQRASRAALSGAKLEFKPIENRLGFDPYPSLGYGAIVRGR